MISNDLGVFKILTKCHENGPTKNDFRKKSFVFRPANDCLNADSKRYQLPSKWLWTDLFDRKYLKHPALTSGRNGARRTLLANLLCDLSVLELFTNRDFCSTVEKQNCSKVLLQDRKPILFNTGQLAFAISNDFICFKSSTKVYNKNTKIDQGNIFAKVSLSTGGQIIISILILRGIHCLWNEFEQI